MISSCHFEGIFIMTQITLLLSLRSKLLVVDLFRVKIDTLMQRRRLVA